MFIIVPVGYIIAFGIVLGCLFRGLYLLNDISKSKVAPKKDRVTDVYEDYMKEKEITAKSPIVNRPQNIEDCIIRTCLNKYLLH